MVEKSHCVEFPVEKKHARRSAYFCFGPEISSSATSNNSFCGLRLRVMVRVRVLVRVVEEEVEECCLFDQHGSGGYIKTHTSR